jgi:hypothetical protein
VTKFRESRQIAASTRNIAPIEQRSGVADPIDQLPEYRDQPGHGDGEEDDVVGCVMKGELSELRGRSRSLLPSDSGHLDRSFSRFLRRSRAASDPAAP